MRKLLLLRHAKSSWKQEELDDFDRPLNKRGQRDAPRMGELIRQHNLIPERVLCSPARRTRDTLEAMLPFWELRPTVLYPDKLYESSQTTIQRIISQHAEEGESLLVIAHNPGLQELLERLTGESRRFPTAALAWLEFADGWSVNGTAELRGLWYPRELEPG